MTDDGCPPGGETTERLSCPRCHSDARAVPHETLYHLLKPARARGVSPKKTYGVCRERGCPVLYFSEDQNRIWETTEARAVIGFKQPVDEPPHPVCYCFGYTEENLAEEIEETGESTAVEWITQRVQDDECACEYKNPTGRCCLGEVREAVENALR